MSNHAPALHPAVAGCLEACRRCERLLDLVSDELYTKSNKLHDSIGGHLRHGLEHMTCFLVGIDSGVIEYDARKRSADLETNRSFFRNALQKTGQDLRRISRETIEGEIRVKQIQAPGAEAREMTTTVERELVFLSSHLIHHLALAVFVCRHEGIEVPQDIGLAFSTSAYREAAVG